MGPRYSFVKPLSLSITTQALGVAFSELDLKAVL